MGMAAVPGADPPPRPLQFLPAGIPPRARGSLVGHIPASVASASTPACAGQSHSGAADSLPVPVQPRARGRSSVANCRLELIRVLPFGSYGPSEPSSRDCPRRPSASFCNWFRDPGERLVDNDREV